MDYNLVIPLQHIIIFYIVLAVSYGLLFACSEWKNFIEKNKFKKFIYQSKGTKRAIWITLFLLGTIFMPVINIANLINLFKDTIKNFKEDYEQ